MNEREGGPAFPRPYSTDDDGDFRFGRRAQEGMSLRAYFVGQALVGILANPNFVGPFTECDPPWEDIAGDALKAGDAMLAKLEGK